jgi:glycosyltransferase involved in cell wall biosynthesis
MRVLVCTVVHNPADARILHRQIRALLEAGHDVTYIAPFRACRVTPWPELTAADVPRAAGRRRVAALRTARRELARHCGGADLLIVHDPELLLVLPLLRHRPPTVWDVHEDTAAALSSKAWVPRPLRPAFAAAVRQAERIAERRIHLILAESGYRDRFAAAHPVVPNTTYVPERPLLPPGSGRVVYLGHLSRARGAGDMIEVARLLQPHGVTVDLIGDADTSLRADLSRAQADGLIRWYGFVPNGDAVRMLDGALAGIALLHDEPNYRHSLPTKVAEYMARGLPVVTSPNPPAAELVNRYECGFVVPFGDPAAAAEAVLRLRRDPGLRMQFAMRGHRGALESLRWPEAAREFVGQLEAWAAEGGRVPSAPAPRSAAGTAPEATASRSAPPPVVQRTGTTPP